ncbi:hypothetical protein [Nonomuraea sp. NPDC050691]|uniref:hypothetical protein n=1 Tax=Nonomuraea sp. NPDC050691 TaxID=3155661 RepID=UPI0033E7721F
MSCGFGTDVRAGPDRCPGGRRFTGDRRADDTSDTPALVLAGYVRISTITFIGVAVFAGLTYAITTHRGALLVLAAGPYTALTAMNMIAGIAWRRRSP